MRRAISYVCFAAILCIARAARVEPPSSSILHLFTSVKRDIREHHHSLDVEDLTGDTPDVDDLTGDTPDGAFVEPADKAEKFEEKVHAGATIKTSQEIEAMDRMLATGLAMMFLGVVFLAGFVSFLLTYPDDQVRYYCVRIANSTVIIFLAIAIEYAALLSTLVEWVTGWTTGWKIRIIPFFFWWSLTLFVSYIVRRSHLNLVAAKSVLAHVAAFVAIYFFSSLMYKYTKTISKKEAATLFFGRIGVLFVFGLFFWGLKFFTMKLLRRLPYDCPFPEHGHAEHGHAEHGHAGHSHAEHGHGSHEGHGGHAQEQYDETGRMEEHHTKDTPHSVLHFEEEVEEGFEEASLLVLSYVAAKYLVYKTTLELCGLDHTDDTWAHRRTFWRLDNGSVKTAILIIGLATLLLKMMILILDRQFTSRYNLHSLPTFLCMSVAWVFMYFIKALLLVPMAEAHCILVMSAFVMTPLAGLLVVAADFFADKGSISDDLADTLVTSYGFMIGFSWEKAFHSSVHLLMDDYFDGGRLYESHGEAHVKFLITVAVCAGAVVLMLPGWRYLILPSALKPMPPRKKLDHLADKADKMEESGEI